MIKEHFKKELVMIKKDNEDFENSTNKWICDNDYIDGDIKVRDHDYITENIEVLHIKKILKIHVVFDNLKNYDSHLIMQVLGKLNLELNFRSNGLKKYIRFIINNKLCFIHSS